MEYVSSLTLLPRLLGVNGGLCCLSVCYTYKGVKQVYMRQGFIRACSRTWLHVP